MATVPASGQPSVRARVARLSVRQQVAQLVMPWLLGNYVGFDADGLAQARSWVDSLEIGGIVISIGSPLDVAAKLNFLQRRSKIPLLIASDLEGGASYRFTGATPFPTNLAVGATGREQDAFTMGRITGLEGRAVGVHLNFAPDADVNNNPANPIINTRSFGGDPATVARMVAAAIRGSRSTGLLSTAKHFPGHGDTDTDSHIALPVIRADWQRLNAVELVPFRAAIAARVDAVMSAHVALPGFDPDSSRPATLSPAILTGILRDSLGFTGLAVTDALDMGALVTKYGAGEAAVQAFLAGSDLLLMPANPREAIAAMVAAVELGRISKARLLASATRVMAIKARLGLFRKRTVPLGRIGTIVGRRASIEAAADITARSLVLVRDQAGLVDQLRGSPSDLVVVSYGDPGGATTFTATLGKAGYRVSHVRIGPSSGPASYDSARAALLGDAKPVFAVTVRVSSGSGSIAMPADLGALIESVSQTRPTVLVSFGSPYLLAQVPSVAAFLLAWTSNPLTEAAAARALAGAPIAGRLPIDLPPTYRIGDGLIRNAAQSSDVSRR